MKLITRDTDYAVRALAFIAKNKKELVSVSDLVRELKIPRPFLRKILQILNKNKILISYKGVGGGFKLAKKTNSISLTDIINVFQGQLKLNECLFRKKVCPNRKTCFLKEKIDHIEKIVAKELDSIKINSLLK